MFRRRTRSVVSRLLVAAFALWLPVATGQGGKATCIAASSLAKSMTERPHLSCHGEAGAKTKNCCCKGEQAIRAAACGCHDGQTVFGTAAHDPTIGSWSWRLGARPSQRRAVAAALVVPQGPPADAPDPPPPRSLPSDQA